MSVEHNEKLSQNFTQAEMYGQFADSTTKVTQEKDGKQKPAERKRRTKEATYYRQGILTPYRPKSV